MPQNVQIKAYAAEPQKLAAACVSLGARTIGQSRQQDTYFLAPIGQLKLREEGENFSLLYRSRLTDQEDTTVESAALAEGASVGRVLGGSLGVWAVVDKQRTSFRLDPALINMDSLEGLGAFLEIEIDVAGAVELEQAHSAARDILDKLGLSHADLLPWSYAQLRVMHDAARRWRTDLARAGAAGTVFLLDGASCSGKTTLARKIAAETDLNLTFIPRYCTRQPRPGLPSEAEYIFVDGDRFNTMAAAGDFIEYKDFKFGMSYGFPWRETLSAATAGRNAIGIMDLGSVRHVKQIFPEAITILVGAPEATIRERLARRGLNTAEQIEERLANARKVQSYLAYYDYVVNNDDGLLAEAEENIRDIIRREGRGTAGA